MTRSWVLLLTVAFCAALTLVLVQCSAGGDDDDDDDDDECVAEDVAGTYLVRFEITQDSCEEENVGVTRTGALRIDQKTVEGIPQGDVDVYFTPDGGTSEELVFVGTVCGFQVIGNLFSDDSFENRDCTVSTESIYTLTVTDTGAGRQLAGTHNETTTANGTGCPSVIRPGTTCTLVETISPI